MQPHPSVARRLTSLSLGTLALVALSPLVSAQNTNPSVIAPAENLERAGGPLSAGFDESRKAVVHVFVEVKGRETFKLQRPSTGVVVSADGLVLTWWDLVAEGFAEDDDNRTVHVQFVDGERLPATLVDTDDDTGLTLLQVQAEDGRFLPFVELRKDRAEAGEPVGVLSFGDGEEHVGFAGVATPALGAVRFKTPKGGTESVDAEKLLLTDAAIQERSHGAALVDVTGALAGVCDARNVRTNASEPTLAELKAPNYGVVIPSDTIRRMFPARLGRLSTASAPQNDPGVDAVATASKAVVAVHAGRVDAIGDNDPFGKQRRAGVGSGVVVDESGLVLTNLHIVSENTDAIRVVFTGGQSFEAEILERHRPTNTALLRVETRGKRLPAITFASGPESLRPGDRVFALGNPEGSAVGIASGILSAKRRSQIQVDATLGNHNAGGPVIDDRGHLVGLVDGGAEDRVDVAFKRRGDEAKLDSGLYYTTGLAALRSAYADLADVKTADTDPNDAHLGIGAIVDRVAPSMLNIYIERVIVTEEDLDNPFAEVETQSFPVSLGSGVIITSTGLALTNWHVVDSATYPDGSPRDDHVVTATRYGGRKYDVRVLSISREEDLALVQLQLEPGEVLPAVELGSSDVLQPGDRAFAIGNPEGNANTITAGVVVAVDQKTRVKGRWADLKHLIETSAAINGGNSGGALLDGAGRLIGINSAGGNAFNTTGYAIAVDHVRRRLNRVLLSSRKLRAAYLGIDVRDREDGVEVVRVEPDGPGERAGVQRGDLVQRVGDRPITWSVDFALAALDHDAARPIEVTFQRGGAKKSVQVQALSADVRGIERQLGVEVEQLGYGDDPELFQAAATALYRQITGNPNGEPYEFPRTLVRVRAVSPIGTQRFEAEMNVELPDPHPLAAGDLLLAATWERRIEGATTREVIEFEDLRQLRETMHQAGDYGGNPVSVFVYRGDKLVPLTIVAARQLP